MAKHYIVTAPAVDVILGGDDTGGGKLVRILQAGQLPADTPKETITRLLRRDMIVESDGAGGLQIEALGRALAGGDPDDGSASDPGSSGGAGGSAGGLGPLPGNATDDEIDAWLAQAKVSDAVAVAKADPALSGKLAAGEQRRGDKARATLLKALEELDKQQGGA